MNATDSDFYQDPETGRILGRDGAAYELFAVDEVARLRAELAAERARWEWLEAGGSVFRSSGRWAAQNDWLRDVGQDFECLPCVRKYHRADDPRTAIDEAMKGEVCHELER